MKHLKLQNLVSAKAQIFSIDSMFALIFCLMFVMVFNINEEKELENNIVLIKIQKINDLLITSQYLKINNISELETNYLLLFPNTCGYIKINNTEKEINCKNFKKNKLISNSIRYINNINHNVYIEIGIY